MDNQGEKKGLRGWVEVFRAGKHADSRGRTREFTAADLDRMVDSYDPAHHEAPAVIGHPKDNAPAWGWVDGLKRAGSTLLARFRQVAPEFEEMVAAGRFKKRSISIYPDGGLRHVGFLGAQPPAVKALEDISFAADEECNTYEFEEDQSMDKVAELEKKLEAEKVAREKAEAAARSFQEKSEIQAAEFAEAEKKRRHRELVDFVEAGVKNGKILPAWQEKGLVEFMAALDGVEGEWEFAEGKKESPAGWFRGFLADFSAHPLFKEFTKADDKSGDHAEIGGFDAELTNHM